MNPHFDRTFEPAYGEAVSVGPAVRRITAPNPGPYTFHGTNTYLIGTSSVIAIDPGPDDPAHVRSILRAVDAGGGALAMIVLTHGHGDHSAGVAAVVASAGVPLAASRLLSSGVPDLALDDGSTIVTDAGPLRVLSTPGHSADHLSFALEGTPNLFSGDHVMAWSTSVIAAPDGSMADYIASLDRVADRPERVYWPGHGGPVLDGPQFAAALKAHRFEREAMILEAMAKGATSVTAIVETVYVGLDPALTGAAAQSVQAHIDWLVERGVVTTESRSRPTYRLLV